MMPAPPVRTGLGAGVGAVGKIVSSDLASPCGLVETDKTQAMIVAVTQRTETFSGHLWIRFLQSRFLEFIDVRAQPVEQLYRRCPRQSFVV
jgi:hypothetical protein